jgi:hypothetical protein
MYCRYIVTISITEYSTKDFFVGADSLEEAETEAMQECEEYCDGDGLDPRSFAVVSVYQKIK